MAQFVQSQVKKIMKTKLIIMLLSTLFALDATARVGLDRIVVISDIHLLSPELVVPHQSG